MLTLTETVAAASPDLILVAAIIGIALIFIRFKSNMAIWNLGSISMFMFIAVTHNPRSVFFIILMLVVSLILLLDMFKVR